MDLPKARRFWGARGRDRAVVGGKRLGVLFHCANCRSETASAPPRRWGKLEKYGLVRLPTHWAIGRSLTQLLRRSSPDGARPVILEQSRTALCASRAARKI